MATSGKTRLPSLPKGYFGDTQLTDDERTKIRDTIRAQLELTLADELAFVHAAKRKVDTAKWRLVKRKRELRVFRRRAHADVFTGGTDAYKPSVLTVGRIEGSIEDVLLGAYHTSHDEVKTTVAFTKAAADCTVLTNLELATPDDPYHYLGVKWFYTQLPASVVIKPRDWCVAHAMGIERDSHGVRFGYYMLRSVDVRSCPPFDQLAVVRGKAQLCCIYREPVPGIVEVYSHGLYDPAGELIQHFSNKMSTKVVTSVFRLAQCAEAKKLTLLALRNFQRKRTAPGPVTSDSNGRACARCRGSGGYFSSLKACGVCSAVVCSQCRAKKSIFVGASHSVYKVSCCVQCISEAKNMPIRPAERSFSILGEQFLPREQYSGLESSDTRDEQSTPTDKRLGCAETEDENDGGEVSVWTDDLSELDVDQHQFSNNGDSGFSQDDMERLLASMLAQRQQDKKEQQKRLDDNGGSDSRGSSDAPTSSSENHSLVRITSHSRMGFEPGESFVRDSSGDRGAGASSSSSRTSASASAAAAAAAAAMTRGMAPQQAAVYYKILALQSAANEAYWMVRSNTEKMRSTS